MEILFTLLGMAVFVFVPWLIGCVIAKYGGGVESHLSRWCLGVGALGLLMIITVPGYLLGHYFYSLIK